jgi:hypothetical protein
MIGPGQNNDRDVFIQSQTEPLFQYYLMRELQTGITLAQDINIDDEQVVLSAGNGFVTGGDLDQMIMIVEGDRFEQLSVLSVEPDNITINLVMPIGGAFSAANAKIIRGNKNLAVDATPGAPVEAVFRFYDQVNTFVPIDFSKVKISMTHTQAGDDGKFGGITALSDGGIYFRRINADRINLGNYVNNQSFKDFGADVNYTSKGPGGTESTEIAWDLQDTFDKVLRLNPQHNDQICMVNRNALATGGLASFYFSIIGSFTAGES